MDDLSQKDPREVEAESWDLNYVKLQGKFIKITLKEMLDVWLMEQGLLWRWPPWTS